MRHHAGRLVHDDERGILVHYWHEDVFGGELRSGGLRQVQANQGIERDISRSGHAQRQRPHPDHEWELDAALGVEESLRPVNQPDGHAHRSHDRETAQRAQQPKRNQQTANKLRQSGNPCPEGGGNQPHSVQVSREAGDPATSIPSKQLLSSMGGDCEAQSDPKHQQPQAGHRFSL